MKKLLGILGAMGLVCSTSANVISCGDNSPKADDSDILALLPKEYPKSVDDLKALLASKKETIKNISDAAYKAIMQANKDNPKISLEPKVDSLNNDTKEFIKSNNDYQKFIVLEDAATAIGYLYFHLTNDKGDGFNYADGSHISTITSPYHKFGFDDYLTNHTNTIKSIADWYKKVPKLKLSDVVKTTQLTITYSKDMGDDQIISNIDENNKDLNLDSESVTITNKKEAGFTITANDGSNSDGEICAFTGKVDLTFKTT
ncbi:lipoprotein [Spiroplasma endosymbiont of Aspidapion aeneum]|uniref:lipoprotein n=1 Tax=Spiroplasma endosymbiont of Aspidapion aeneum TaxID=3066276 RepID=UPI00313DFD2D